MGLRLGRAYGANGMVSLRLPLLLGVDMNKCQHPGGVALEMATARESATPRSS